MIPVWNLIGVKQSVCLGCLFLHDTLDLLCLPLKETSADPMTISYSDKFVSPGGSHWNPQPLYAFGYSITMQLQSNFMLFMSVDKVWMYSGYPCFLRTLAMPKLSFDKVQIDRRYQHYILTLSELKFYVILCLDEVWMNYGYQYLV